MTLKGLYYRGIIVTGKNFNIIFQKLVGETRQGFNGGGEDRLQFEKWMPPFRIAASNSQNSTIIQCLKAKKKKKKIHLLNF